MRAKTKLVWGVKVRDRILFDCYGALISSSKKWQMEEELCGSEKVVRLEIREVREKKGKK